MGTAQLSQPQHRQTLEWLELVYDSPLCTTSVQVKTDILTDSSGIHNNKSRFYRPIWHYHFSQIPIANMSHAVAILLRSTDPDRHWYSICWLGQDEYYGPVSLLYHLAALTTLNGHQPCNTARASKRFQARLAPPMDSANSHVS